MYLSPTAKCTEIIFPVNVFACIINKSLINYKMDFMMTFKTNKHDLRTHKWQKLSQFWL